MTSRSEASIRSSLANSIMSGPTSTRDLDTMRRRAWREQGVVALKPEDINDDWLRQAVVNEAVKRWGKR
jgi:hypothetical protein